MLQTQSKLMVRHEWYGQLHHLLSAVRLPASNMPLPKMTTMANRVTEMRAMHPAAAWLNAVVLGRMSHRVLPRLLTWHEVGPVAFAHLLRVQIQLTTTSEHFPEVKKSRIAYEKFTSVGRNWLKYFDQWQSSVSKHTLCSQ